MGSNCDENHEYDALTAPDAARWLGMGEEERIIAVQAYHEAHDPQHAEMPNPRLHATLHVVVENQLAMNEPAGVGSTVDRLISEGLDRHDAIHAVATVVADFVWGVLREGKKGFDAEEHRQALAKLSAQSWVDTFRPKESPNR